MTALHGFVYGECLEGTPPRSLGYRLLTPTGPEPWRAEVEALARLLQAAHYSDHWPPVDLFCSVLLAAGARLIGVARYGLTDQTPNRRRGGVELFGVIGPGSLGVPSALAIDHWLRKRREDAGGLGWLSDPHWLDAVLTDVPPVVVPAEADLPQSFPAGPEGACLFTAREPREPDTCLSALERHIAGNAGNWQWLPFVGDHFSWQEYSRRGPLFAWTASNRP